MQVHQVFAELAETRSIDYLAVLHYIHGTQFIAESLKEQVPIQLVEHQLPPALRLLLVQRLEFVAVGYVVLKTRVESELG